MGSALRQELEEKLFFKFGPQLKRLLLKTSLLNYFSKSPRLWRPSFSVHFLPSLCKATYKEIHIC
jgi:hypothetical protein